MKIQTQIRRTFASLAAIAGFSCVALVQGDTIEHTDPMAVFAATCPDADLIELPDAVIRVAAPVRVDWRVRVPATIARSRS